MNTYDALPDGYIRPFHKEKIPDNFSPLNGEDGTPDLSNKEIIISSGDGLFVLTYPNDRYVLCMKNFKNFIMKNPDWSFSM